MVTTEDQVEDAEMGTFMVEAMEGAGRGMAQRTSTGDTTAI